VTDYSQASDVTISCDSSNIQQRLLQQGFPQLAGRHTVVDRNMVEMNLKNSKIIVVNLDIDDHLDSYREDQGCNWFSGS
jgi:hypothetical protein